MMNDKWWTSDNFPKLFSPLVTDWLQHVATPFWAPGPNKNVIPVGFCAQKKADENNKNLIQWNHLVKSYVVKKAYSSDHIISYQTNNQPGSHVPPFPTAVQSRDTGPIFILHIFQQPLLKPVKLGRIILPGWCFFQWRWGIWNLRGIQGVLQT